MDLIIETLFHACVHAGVDCLKMLPFLFAAFLLIEALEHHGSRKLARGLARVGKAGPVAGALLGCIPQCGFSVIAANLYAGGVISPGTLLAVFVATSDEAVLILLGSPGSAGEVLPLLAGKILIAVLAGYVTDLVLRGQIEEPKEVGELCHHCGCHKAGAGLLRPALNHTVRIFLYLFVFTVILNLVIEVFGIRQLSTFLLGNTPVQPLAAAVVGLIPNCAASVMLTQLYLSGAISFASVMAGLCTGAGVGLIVLFKMNESRRENLKLLGLLVVTGMAAGMALELLKF